MPSFLIVMTCNSMTIGGISTLICCSSICIPMPILASIALCSTSLNGCASLTYCVSLWLFGGFGVGIGVGIGLGVGVEIWMGIGMRMYLWCYSNWMHKIGVLIHCLSPVLKDYC